VPEGLITLRANAGDFLTSSRSASATVTIGPGQAEATAEIVFEAGFRVDGHVTRGGKPVPDAMVMPFPDGGNRRSANGRTDDGGGYVLEGLDAAKYTFTASSQSGGPIRRTVEIGGDTTVDLDAPPARLAGTVVEAESGRPLGDVSVRIEEEQGGARFMNMATTDSSGRFGFEDLEPSRYRVSFQKAAYQVETRELTAAEDSDVRVELKRGEGIELEPRTASSRRRCAGCSCAWWTAPATRPSRAASRSTATAAARCRRSSPASTTCARSRPATLRSACRASRSRSHAQPAAHARRLARDPGRPGDARAAAADRPPDRSRPADLHVERLHHRRQDPPERPGATARERRARLLHPRGRGRRPPRRRDHGGRTRRREPAVSVFSAIGYGRPALVAPGSGKIQS
jgi:5-hydroxyisourate hydrolase-like protein (transthyretin family)